MCHLRLVAPNPDVAVAVTVAVVVAVAVVVVWGVGPVIERRKACLVTSFGLPCRAVEPS